MSEKKIKSSDRRKLLKSAALGGGVLGASQINTEKWLKPVVNSVVLPAHAATTDTGGLPGEVGAKYSFIDPAWNPENTNAALRGMLGKNARKNPTPNQTSLANRMLEALVPSAHAQQIDESSLLRLELYLEIIATDLYHFVFFSSGSPEPGIFIVFFGEAPSVGPGEGSMQMRMCAGEGPSGNADFTITDITPNTITVIVGSETFTLFYDAAAQAPVELACEGEGDVPF